MGDVCKIAAILSQPQFIETLQPETVFSAEE